ncbi:MAG: DinB family protein [Gemmatimonadetes bacterium]|nr:DinB family protein [Gemmatimonadota bacterium]MBI2614109.1 DinB family protein [Gemmatimonadota bacterium]MBI3082666.1 DinB family protein [Gemmatimonadota bacterium]
MTATTPREQFLEAYEREHQTTLRVLRAYPKDKLDLRPHPTCKSARELAWMFVLERGLGTRVYHNAFATGGPPSGKPPAPPESWDALLGALAKAHQDVGKLVRSTPDAKLHEKVKFMTGPKTLGDWTRMGFLWFLLHHQIHHRGQFSVYLRMAGGRVPSIYGPSADEPWT